MEDLYLEDVLRLVAAPGSGSHNGHAAGSGKARLASGAGASSSVSQVSSVPGRLPCWGLLVSPPAVPQSIARKLARAEQTNAHWVLANALC